MSPDNVPLSSNGSQVSVIIADANALARTGLRRLLARFNDCEVIDIAQTGQEAIHKSSEFKPDLLILDINIPGLNALEVISRIVQTAPQTRALLLSASTTPSALRHALNVGVHGYVLRSDPEAYILNAIRAIARGGSFITPTADSMLKALCRVRPDGHLRRLFSTNRLRCCDSRTL